MMMPTKMFQVDAFSQEPFSGNPAAVCLLPGTISASWMQNVAAEMNLSETAFLWPMADGFSLRWFTPTTEVKLCGHATLASAHILWEQGLLDHTQAAIFHTKSGRLRAVSQMDGIELDFPAAPAKPAKVNHKLLAALGDIEPVETRQAGEKYLIIVDGQEVVREMAPDFTAMSKLAGRGVMVTSATNTAEFDFISRYFAPWIGINEDPVTGSAHCTLGPYWAEKLGKTILRAHQASPRGGTMTVRPAGERVYLLGQAVTVLAGELTA
jgi:PhzF family phenazine biosynthesis protein